MATVKVVVLKHQKKEDKTWNVKLRITHNRESAYISTPYFLNAKFLTDDFKIKERNNPVYDAVMVEALKVRAELTRLGRSVDNFTAKNLCSHIEDVLSGNNSKTLKFFEVARCYIDESISNGKRIGTVNKARINSFEEFCGKDIEFSAITLSVIEKYEKHLRERGLSNVSIIDYIGSVRFIFNKAREQYNDEDTGVIRIINNPFRKYKFPKKPQSRKKALSKDQILSIMNYETKYKGMEIGRDAFIISFLLAGINSVDIYSIDKIKDGRIEYERSKTKDRRADNAFISVKIEDELKPYLERYKDNDRVFCFYKRNATSMNFNQAINEKLKKIGTELGIDNLTFYAARYSWATIARNECGISMDDIAVCLNHKSEYSITDIYVKRDWEIIDRANRKVIDYIKSIKEQ